MPRKSKKKTQDNKQKVSIFKIIVYGTKIFIKTMPVVFALHLVTSIISALSLGCITLIT